MNWVTLVQSCVLVTLALVWSKGGYFNLFLKVATFFAGALPFIVGAIK